MEFATRMAWGGALALCLLSATPAPDELSHETIAQVWLERHHLEGQGAGKRADFDTLLSGTSVHLTLGVFEVLLPTSMLEDNASFEAARGALLALVDVQQGWGAWVAGETPDRQKKGKKRGRSARDGPVRAWLGALDRKHLGRDGRVRAELTDLAGADEAVRAALVAFRDEQRKGDALGLQRENPGVRLAIFPHRAEFIELVCVAGAVDPTLRPSAWSDGLGTWLEYRAGATRMLALEYAHNDGGPRSVSKDNPEALPQLVAQVAARAFLSEGFDSSLDPALRSAMANALVIDLYGELDTRIDGDVRARSSEGRSAFVPGGNPNGGTLPPTDADSRWRRTQGKEHFVGILARAQKQGGKRVKRRAKLASFRLHSDDGLQEGLVQAPFLGAQAGPPATALLPDYLELLRCYGVAFVHWLRTEAEGARSEERFAKLLHALGRSKGEEDLANHLEALYGQPLSASDLKGLFDSPTLEGRFLNWLSKR